MSMQMAFSSVAIVPRARDVLGPKDSLVVYLRKIYEKSKYSSLTNLTVKPFSQKNDIEEW